MPGPAVLTRGHLLLLCGMIAACAQSEPRLVLATTSSAYDTGLLTHLAGVWQQEEAPPALHILTTGSGEALTLGRRGDADVLLVHAPESEQAFMDAGAGLLRLPVMRNDYIIVGPPADPADVRAAVTPHEALRRIDAHGVFISRGDGSGTHQRERALRSAAGLPARGEPTRYLEVGQGMGETLRIASERRAYTLSDRATFVTWRGDLDLVEFAVADTSLANPYSVIVPLASADTAQARRFAEWLTGARAQALIGRFSAGGAAPLFEPARSSPAR